MKAKRYSTEFKSSIVTLYNEGRSANSLANEYHLAVQTVTGWVKKAQIIGTDVTSKPVTRAQFNQAFTRSQRLAHGHHLFKVE